MTDETVPPKSEKAPEEKSPSGEIKPKPRPLEKPQTPKSREETEVDPFEEGNFPV